MFERVRTSIKNNAGKIQIVVLTGAVIGLGVYGAKTNQKFLEEHEILQGILQDIRDGLIPKMSEDGNSFVFVEASECHCPTEKSKSKVA